MSSARNCRILLFSPELRERTYPGRPPIYYLSSILRSAGYSVATVDVDITGQSYFVEILQSFQPAIVAGTSLSVQINEAIELLKLAKTYCPEAVTILGGTHATAAGEFMYPFHKDYLDAVVVGEGLTAILTVADRVERGLWQSRKNEVPGLLFWEDGQLCHGASLVSESVDTYDIDLSYHHPSYDFEIFFRDDGTPRRTFQMMTARGCLNACFFCFASTNKHNESRRMENRVTLSVIEKKLQQAKMLGFQAVYFDDDTFTRDRSHAIEVSRLAKKYELVFGCHTRPDCEDDNLIEALAANGCRYMFSGLETIVPEILRGANKTADPIGYRDAYIRSYSRKKAVGLPTSAFLVHGMPRRDRVLIDDHQRIFRTQRDRITWQPDTLQDSLATVSFAVRELDPTYLSMNVLRFIPGVPFSESAMFEFLRPVKGKLHGGYFDETWLRENGKSDPRCFHPILRAFEGAGSPIPPHMTARRCYDILQHAVNEVNLKNSQPGRNQTRIVVDPWFTQRFLRTTWSGKNLTYELSAFEAIDDTSASSPKATSGLDLRKRLAIV